MRIITSDGLTNNLGAKVRVQREGLVGNLKNPDGTRKEGATLGQLMHAKGLFLINQFMTYWGNEGLVVDENQFMEDFYILRNGDEIYIPYLPYSKRKILRNSIMIRSYKVNI